MISRFKKSITIGILFVLAWSCVGLSLGMIGHVFSMDESTHDMATVHECCIVNTDEAGAAKTSTMDHHTPVIATLSIVNLFGVLLVAIVITLFVSVLHHSTPIKIALYARMWLERCSYFAVYLKRLFSRGILHPKTW